jgi:hypothetical protein
MPRFDVQSLVDGSERLKSYETKIDGDAITIGARPPLTQPVGLSTRYQTVFKQSVPPIAFLGKRVESWIPIDLWAQALLYFIATLPETTASRSPSVTSMWR